MNPWGIVEGFVDILFFSDEFQYEFGCELVRYKHTTNLLLAFLKIDFWFGNKTWGIENLVYYMGLDCSNYDKGLKNYLQGEM